MLTPTESSIRTRILRLAPILVASGMLMVVAPEVLFPVVIALVAILATVIGPRAKLDRATSRLASVVLVLVTVSIVRANVTSIPIGSLGTFGFGFAVTALSLAVARLFVRDAEGGRRFGQLLTLIAIFACGGAKPGAPYLFVLGIFFFALFLEQREGDRARLPVFDIGTRGRVASVLVLALAGGLAVSTAQVTREAYSFAERRFRMGMSAYWDDQIGLGDMVRLGRMTKLLSSDAIVLRVSGGEVERLRGVVLNEYLDGDWSKGGAAQTLPTDVATEPRDDSPRITIRRAIDDHRVVLPLEAENVVHPAGALDVDLFGAASDETGRTVYSFVAGPRDGMAVALPNERDTLLAPKISKAIGDLAAQWTAGIDDKRLALDAIQQHLLREYTYSLVHRPDPRVDPIVDFLWANKNGHCEYFAGAFVLLARSIGVPARLVLGYRVGERNPYFSHYVVRRKNAHAWAEVYVDGWTTYDPTPMTELPQDIRHDQRGFHALRETLLIGWSRLQAWLAERNIYELSVAAVIGLVIFAAQRWWRLRTSASDAGPSHLAYSAPSPRYLELESALALKGKARPPQMPLEAFVDANDLPAVREALVAYAESRYRGLDASEIDALLVRAIEAVRHAP